MWSGKWLNAKISSFLMPFSQRVDYKLRYSAELRPLNAILASQWMSFIVIVLPIVSQGITFWINKSILIGSVRDASRIEFAHPAHINMICFVFHHRWQFKFDIWLFIVLLVCDAKMFGFQNEFVFLIFNLNPTVNCMRILSDKGMTNLFLSRAMPTCVDGFWMNDE